MAGVTTANGIDVPIKPHTQQVAASTPTDLVACFGCFSKLSLTETKKQKRQAQLSLILDMGSGKWYGRLLAAEGFP
jgi:hypothetical protein